MKNVVMVMMMLSAAVSSYGDEIGELGQMKEMYLQTPLVEGGKPACLIVAPDDGAYVVLAEKLSAAIKAADGVAPPVKKAGEVTLQQAQDTNIIALGLFTNNHIVEKLYLQEFVLCDYNFPGGENSYVIRTVHNPWVTGKNVVYIGSTELAACEAAVNRFIEMLEEQPKGAVGPIIEVSIDGEKPAGLSDKQLAESEAKLKSDKNQGSVYASAQSYANQYFVTGQPGWAKLFLSAMRRIDELHNTQGSVASTAPCQWLFRFFDTIEEGPAFSDEERRELTNLFYRFATRLRFTKEPIEPLKTSRGNTVATSTQSAIYWSRYYPDLELGKLQLANMKKLYEPDMVNWKIPEDSPRYGQLTVVRSFKWALTAPDPRYVENELLKKIADYYMLITNNLGNCAGIGDYSGLSSASHLVEVYPLAAWLYKDGRYLWFWDHFAENPRKPGPRFYRHRGNGLMGWVPEEVLPRKRPDDLLGIAKAPLDQWIYDRRNYVEERKFPIAECYDKASFRAGFERDDEYMCMSGFSHGYHSHPDANAIVNYSDQGRTLLYDDGYMVAQPSEHNTVSVLKDGWTGGMPELAQLMSEADFADTGLFQSRLNEYNGLTWDRYVIWPKSRYFLVIDDLEAVEPGGYSLQCVWRTLGKADLDGRRWSSHNAPAKFNLIACSDATLSQKPSAGTSISAPPFPPDKAQRLVQSVGKHMQPGDSYQFANLFYATPDSGEVQHVDAYRLDETTTYVIQDDGKVALAGIKQTDAIAGLSIEGAAFHLADNKLTLANGTRLAVGEPLLSSDTPVNVQIDLTTGATLLEAQEAAEITFTGAQGEQKRSVKPGRHSLKLRAVGEGDLTRIATELTQAHKRLAVAPAASQKPAVGSGEKIAKLWTYSDFEGATEEEIAAGSFQLKILEVADINADGKHEVLSGGTDKAVQAIGADGTRLWKYEVPDIITELEIGVNKAGVRQILAGCENNTVYSLADDGKENWSLVPPPRSYARPGYREGDLTVHQGKPRVIVAADTNNDGDIEIVVGSDKGHVYGFDHAGKLIWDRTSHTPHAMSCGAATDLTGDGNMEVVMGNIYSTGQIFSASGELVGTSGGSGHAGATVVACADMDGDGKGEIAMGDKLGIIWLQAEGEDGKWSRVTNTRKYNTGSDITAVAIGDVDGDGKLETASASKNFVLYLFDAQREPVWQLNLGDVCLDIDIADVTGDGKAEVICGCEDGTIKVVSGEGKIIAWYQAGGVVRHVRACELDGKPETKEIVATCDDGNVYGLQVKW